MSRNKDKNPSGDTGIADEVSEEAKKVENSSRRDFLRRSAEISALSLFGMMRLDAVMAQVVSRTQELGAIRRLGRATAAELAAAPFGALTCTSGFDCPPNQSFYCSKDGSTYTCGASGKGDYFSCDYDFTCNPSFNCKATGGSDFSCLDIITCSSADFKCSGTYTAC